MEFESRIVQPVAIALLYEEEILLSNCNGIHPVVL
jgi:hypothetical protein